jgi:hypothetical protein
VGWSGGTVLAGRSLRLVDQRETNVELLAGAAWLAMLIALAAVWIAAAWLWPKPSERRAEAGPHRASTYSPGVSP